MFINPSFFFFSMQLVQIKKVYSGKRRGKFNAEVKFHNQNGRQYMKLEDSNYDRELRSVSWILLGTDLFESPVVCTHVIAIFQCRLWLSYGALDLTLTSAHDAPDSSPHTSQSPVGDDEDIFCYN